VGLVIAAQALTLPPPMSLDRITPDASMQKVRLPELQGSLRFYLLPARLKRDFC
jgi:hypothetical protein